METHHLAQFAGVFVQISYKVHDAFIYSVRWTDIASIRATLIDLLTVKV